MKLRKIMVPYGSVRKLAAATGFAESTVRLALQGKTDTVADGTVELIRNKALSKEWGGVYSKI